MKTKQTEIGIIPEDWEVKRLGEVSPLQRGFDLTNGQLVHGDYPVVYSNGIVNYHHKFLVRAPGLVTGRSGTIGKFTFVRQDFWPHNTSLWVTNFKDNDPLFIYYLYQSIKIERFSTGSGVPTLNRNDVHDFKIPTPPLAEQKRIAEALSDMDALIANLDALIDKKRNLKQAAMQTLLTPKDGWEVKKLGEVADVVRGGSPRPAGDSRYFNGNFIPWLTVASLTNIPDSQIYVNKTDGFLTQLGSNFSRILEKETVIIANSGATLGVAKLVGVKCCANDGIAALLNVDDTVFKKYVVFFLNTKTKFLREVVATGNGQPNLNTDLIGNLEIPLPPLLEQQAIAQILSDMDSELAGLEGKRAKYKTLKTGMMQELLTGRVRLV
jgi:type I restriction enzyme, S subunit